MNYRTHKKQITITVTTLVAVIVLWLGWVIFVPTSATKTSNSVHVGSGQSLSTIANVLKNKGLIRSTAVFRFYLSGLGRERNLKAGDYLIPTGSTLNDIAMQISGGRGVSTDIEVFIPEGFNIWEIDKRLADAKLIKEGEFVTAYGSREGYLFPDTYRFKPNSSLWEIEQKMELNGQEKTKDLIGGLTAPMRDKILTIASIIEKEARLQSDMELVSGVIDNRTKIQMPLAIDATVAYGACIRIFNSSKTKDCDVTQIGVGKEIKIDSPYNTYTRAGLPIRPISNPGLNSIEAALNPKGNYYYYLSTRDGSQIIFSKTGNEHAVNRRKYLGL
ncbi:MAG: endolytic transglycosylase MltG [Candidatus Pacebacteria bacterium]|nr:endolytic transglycosylase MltG [Candidatus Paceibacterota bacterium]